MAAQDIFKVLFRNSRHSVTPPMDPSASAPMTLNLSPAAAGAATQLCSKAKLAAILGLTLPSGAILVMALVLIILGATAVRKEGSATGYATMVIIGSILLVGSVVALAAGVPLVLALASLNCNNAVQSTGTALAAITPTVAPLVAAANSSGGYSMRNTGAGCKSGSCRAY